MLNPISWSILHFLNHPGSGKPSFDPNQTLDFWGGAWLLAGLTKVVQDGEGGKFPVAHTTDADCCKNSNGLQLLIPSPDKKGVIFFRVNNMIPLPENCGTPQYKAVLSMIVWYNKCKLGFTEQQLAYPLLIADVMQKIPLYGNYNLPSDFVEGVSGGTQASVANICLGVKNIIPCSQRTFKPYTFQDTLILNTPPYESFQIDFNVEFMVCDYQLPDFENPEPCQCIC